MKISGMIKSAVVLVIASVVASAAFAGPQRHEQVPPQGERYAYVWVLGSRIPQKIKTHCGRSDSLRPEQGGGRKDRFVVISRLDMTSRR